MSAYPNVHFAELFERVERKTVLVESQHYDCVGVRWYGMGAFMRERLLGAEISRKQQWIIRSGDVVYNKLFAWKGAFAIADKVVDGCIVSDKFPTYRPNTEVLDPRWLAYYFQMPDIAQQAQALSKGAAAISKLTLNPPQFWELAIPLPALAEQRRIVERIEDLAAQIKEARRLRPEAAEEVEATIHAVLTSIIRDVENDASTERGPIPLFAEINPPRTGELSLAANQPVTFVPMKAVDDITGTIARPENRLFAEVSRGYTCFQEGDVIWARITPCMQNGKAAIARNLLNGLGFGSTEFHVLRSGPKLIPEWLHALVRHKAFHEHAAEHFKGTAGQQRVPESFLKQKVIVVPPLAVQHRIVSELDSLNAEVDRLKVLQAETAAELDALLPSILDRAFKGELS